MSTQICINGKIFGPNEAVISVLDRGLLFGDSIFEVMRTYNQIPFALNQHLERLCSAAKLLGIPVSKQTLKKEIQSTLQRANNPESYIKVIVTRGRGKIGPQIDSSPSPSRIVIVQKLLAPSPLLYQKGAKATLLDIQEIPGGLIPLKRLKVGSFLANVMVLKVAQERKKEEAILIDEKKRILEGGTSNVFIITKTNQLLTPPEDLNILKGITREKVIQIAKNIKITVNEEVFFKEDLFKAKEVFITSSIRGIMPISDIDGVGFQAPGPLTLRLMEKYKELLSFQG
jgi:branched-chain amino acid aminotransferase